ncbi:MAG: group III truncated hemoglobin [Mycobacterium sp.]
MTDLIDRVDVEALLQRFYGRVLDDEVLGEPFTMVRTKGLDAHIPVMADFWETMLFRAGRYRGKVLDAHRRVHDRTTLSGRQFLRWLTIWNDTVDEMYRGPVAEHAKVQAARVAWSMHRALTGANSPELDALVAATRSGRFSPVR